MNLNQPPIRSTKDYALPFLIIVAIGVVVALAFRLFGIWQGGDGANNFGVPGQAQLTALAGEVEAYLPAVEAWKIVGDSATLSAGEKVRTAAAGRAKLEFDDGTELTLGGGVELTITKLQNALTKKTVILVLERGAVWVSPASVTTSEFSIATQLLRIDDPDGEFFFSVENEKESVVANTRGGLTATILDPQNKKKPELKSFIVEIDEMLVVSERRVNLLRIGGEIDLVKTTSDEVRRAPLFVAMNGLPVEPEQATPAAEETADPTTDESAAEPETSQPAPLTAPVVTTGNGQIIAVSEPVTVLGIVSSAAAKVEITYGNKTPYELGRFVAGSGKWNYNASTQLGNLVKGSNTFTVVAIDAAGNRSAATTFTIDYAPPPVAITVPEIEVEVETETEAETEVEEIPAVPEDAATVETDADTTSGVPAVGNETFAAPTVSEPLDGQVFDTVPIHFSGTVPVGTQKVIINEYTLTSFSAGDTVWIYNADLKYENLVVGENEYDVEAVSETGERSSISLKITYEPAVVE